MKQEAPLTLPSDNSSSSSADVSASSSNSPLHVISEDMSWRPLDGVVEFKEVAMRYRPDLPLSLKKINFKTRKFEKVIICGVHLLLIRILIQLIIA
jgi:ABC-type multidrug transport system fused ATPase/permease subunit